MNVDFLEEPELQFGAGQHIDIRFGLMNLGPLDIEQTSAPRTIRVGLIGTPQTVEGVIEWLEKCKSEIPAKPSPRNHLFPRFPGFRRDVAFRADVACDSRSQREIPERQLNPLIERRRYKALEEIVDIFLQEIRYLVESVTTDVIICAPPAALDRGALAGSSDSDDDASTDERGSFRRMPTFHDLLKARAMMLRKPIQFIFPATYGHPIPRPPRVIRKLQDEATRAWNFYTALYYKAGGRPWRLVRDPSEFTTCFVGVSFYRSADQARLMTSMAQIFNERGHGVVVLGAPAAISKDDPRPHLTSEHAGDLLSKALTHYREEHRTLPARIVLHKTSAHTAEEIHGFTTAAKEHSIHSIDLISMSSSTTRLFRMGIYPPLRGTVWLTKNGPHFLYTRGSVQFYSTYPGLYVPRPIQYQIELGDCTPKSAGRELLELTKMNWNSTQFDNADPITVRAARQVGSILRYVDEGSLVEHRYSYYM